MNINEILLELISIESIVHTNEYVNMIDMSVEDDESFLLANGIISHNSAAGSIKQARDSESEGVYALKGKVKNTKKLSDLTNNAEILEIMSVLDIEPGSNKQPNYDKIIIASDEDPDGQHITSLIINFFQKWFPHIIEHKKIYKIMTPLVVCTYEKERKYFYSLEEYEEFSNNKRVTNVNYLKGLGSLSIEDWVYVMNNKVLFQIVLDRSADKYLDIAFGNSANKRKHFLEGKRI